MWPLLFRNSDMIFVGAPCSSFFFLFSLKLMIFCSLFTTVSRAATSCSECSEQNKWSMKTARRLLLLLLLSWRRSVCFSWRKFGRWVTMLSLSLTHGVFMLDHHQMHRPLLTRPRRHAALCSPGVITHADNLPFPF